MFGERVRIGRDLKSQREGRPYTQLDLANDLGKSRNAVDAWENGRSYPPPHTRKKAAEKLGVTLDYLEGRSSSPTAATPAEHDYITSAPIPRAMGVVREGSEIRFKSPTSAQKGRVWLEGFLLELAKAGAEEPFIESARRLLLNPMNYEHGFGAAAGALDEMDDERKLKHMKALAEGKAALNARKVKTR